MPTLDTRTIRIGWLVSRKFNWPDTLPERRKRQLGLDGPRIRLVEEYRAELDAMDDEALNALYDAEYKQHHEAEAAAQKAQAERHAAEAASREAAEFYNFPADASTYDYWSKASYWTLDEAVLLARGRRPEFCNLEHLRANRSVSAFAGEFARLRELAKRAVTMGQLFDPVVPTFFLAWAKRMDFPVVPDLIEAVEARGEQILDWKSIADTREETIETYKQTVKAQGEFIERLTNALREERTRQPSEKGLGTRERESLPKLALGMAIKGYSYDPSAARNVATSEIADDLTALGIPLDQDTVRKWLKEGIELLPRPDNEDR
jgi:hypothetical protein